MSRPRIAGRTPRGFADYGVVTDSRGNTVTVRQSSAAGPPCVWLFTKDAEGDDVHECVGAPGGRQSVSPHLTRGQALRLVQYLQRFLRETAP